MVSMLSPDGLLSLMVGGGDDASPLTGEPGAECRLLEAGTIDSTVNDSATGHVKIFRCGFVQFKWTQSFQACFSIILFGPVFIMLF